VVEAPPPITWTNRSVVLLLEEERRGGGRADDPAALIAARACRLALEAMEDGWMGPPFDPFELAEKRGVGLFAREDVADARLVPGSPPRIEFNPHRHGPRVRFSIAHELAHLLFSDHDEQIQHRGAPASGDAWQLELLCNVAAAELLMPAGAFPQERLDDLSLAHLLDVRTRFGVSTEAVLRRAVRLTDRPAAMFAATRREIDARIDYVVPSRAWAAPVKAGYETEPSTSLRRCTAVGHSVTASETWAGTDLRIQAVGVPPYPGHQFPRIVGIVEPVEHVPPPHGRLTYVRGDATNPLGDGAMIIAHVVNDRARSWGGHGFASSLARQFPAVQTDYVKWASEADHPSLGTVHCADVAPGLTVATMVAQAGYGEERRPRVKLAALRSCLRIVAGLALEKGASIHMPPIGTGLGGMQWPLMRDIIVQDLCEANVPVTVYVLPGSPMPADVEPQLSLFSTT
jgi:Zn-dependent peptidase ImmA (M78 family)/O-acetyl-ADP-ribose deacetylase (regulator of RNase III)